MDDSKQPAEQDVEAPDEDGSFYIESHIKIFDPETQEVFVNKRAE